MRKLLITCEIISFVSFIRTEGKEARFCNIEKADGETAKATSLAWGNLRLIKKKNAFLKIGKTCTYIWYRKE